MSDAPKKPLLPVPEALSRLLAGAKPLETETVNINKAHGRVLAEDIAAKRTQPPFAASAMDGYAMRATDLAIAGAKLKVIGEIAAGYVFEGDINEGECVRIFTGAPLPKSADAILIQEDVTLLSDGFIQANEAVKKNTYVRAAGLDFTEGERLLAQGRILDAGAVSLAASGNYATLPVIRKPRVGILATGDELRLPGSVLEAGQIIASNSYGVSAIASEHGAEIIDLGIATDNQASLQAALNKALTAKCDILVTLGGASVGEHDLVQSVFLKAGMALDFWKIAMRPGKPLMFGTLGKMRILGLPGNPVSSLVCTHLFVAPLICALAGKQHTHIKQQAVLETPMKANGPRAQYARAIVTRTNSSFSAKVFENQDSSIITFYAQANALVIRPVDAPMAKIGETVDFIAISEIN